MTRLEEVEKKIKKLEHQRFQEGDTSRLTMVRLNGLYVLRKHYQEFPPPTVD